MNKPLRRVTMVVVIMVLALLANATYIQVFRADSLRADPRNERVLLDEYSRQRGSILAGPDVMANSVSTDDRYKYLRVYPEASAKAYSPITGYYSMVYASGGVERAEEPLLNGSDNRLFGRRMIDLVQGRDPRGGNVITTINPAMQKVAYDKLTSACGPKPCHGAAVAIEPTTGKILAMVSTPGYDPNPLSSHDPSVASAAWKKLQNDDSDPMLNRAISQTYPPGSTFKVITTAAALSQGSANVDTRLTSSSTITLPDSTTSLTNYARETCPESAGGSVSLLQAFEYSCNTAFVQLATQKLRNGEDALKQMATNFGLNTTPDPIPLRVAESTTGPVDDGAKLGQSAIGQRDVSLTPLQNAEIAATLANGGIRMQPYLVDSLQAPDLTTLATTQPHRLGQAISPDVATTMRTLMVASEQHTKGSGGPVPIASKTGTAEHSTGRSDEPPHAWYIAYGPVNDPKVAVAVIIENGGNEGEAATGGSIAAPIGRAVIGAAVNGQGN
ncbi:penicillin-binding protein 2 [Tsukamurella sp. 8F]|uniref:peptidoglycan D,D-transpeptidase FtsI family protein n=1 Tax=unclassified Tsukamurella TaxID=2633480 RepID=UPI0023B8EE75|nr:MULTISPECIES: penicillin-binding protein 2 [unclassified Tsukamurella]MDF0529377.1 penicillin-binding protein 2 [Tsukamurella sp. 8J]MDF0587116.1 penicillin-binding protein 2 [Tsukamurella sp. 8F]